MNRDEWTEWKNHPGTKRLLAEIEDRYGKAQADLTDFARVAGSRTIEEIGACTVENVSRMDELSEIESFITTEAEDEDITSR